MQIDNDRCMPGNGNERATLLPPKHSYMPAAQGQRMRRSWSVSIDSLHLRSNTESSFANWIPISAHFPTVLSVSDCFAVPAFAKPSFLYPPYKCRMQCAPGSGRSILVADSLPSGRGRGSNLFGKFSSVSSECATGHWGNTLAAFCFILNQHSSL